MLTTKTNPATELLATQPLVTEPLVTEPFAATMARNTRAFLLSSFLLIIAPGLLAQNPIEKTEAAHKKGQTSISHYQRAVAQDSSNHLAKFELVGLYLNEKRLADALRLLDKLTDNHSSNAQYLELQGDLARQLSDWESAKGWYQQALAATPTQAKLAVLQLKLGQALQQLGADTAADKAFAEYARLEGILDQSGKKQ